MRFIILTVVLFLGTAVLYFWFFRAKDEDYDEQKQIPLMDHDNPDRYRGGGEHE